jgi:trehalose synthase
MMSATRLAGFCSSPADLPGLSDDDGVKDPRLVTIPTRSVAQLGELIDPDRLRELLTGADRFRRQLDGRTLWHVNSTVAGGGVAEMLQALLGYVLDQDIDVRWLAIDGDPEFFALTKRLHNRIHGAAAGHELDMADAEHYARVSAKNADALTSLISPGDLVVLHDPQTVGLAAALAEHGALVVWRCHIGADEQTEVTRAAWQFLRPHMTAARAHVFSRPQYRPPWLPSAATWIIPPSIDPFAPKNHDLSDETVLSILRTIGVFKEDAVQPGRFVRRDGRPGEVTRAAGVVADELPGLDDPIVLQVSRWDRLKDMHGVMEAFAAQVAMSGPGYLILAGPEVSKVSDDPEGPAVYAECERAWRWLPPAARRRVMLITLPMDDVDENAAMVNALQRRAAVVAQKSLAEGFGLTVAEAMWKRRPVVGSAVGGIQDQIVDGAGLLVHPTDPIEFGTAVRRLLDNPDTAAAMGEAAHAHVLGTYLGDRHMLRWARLFGSLR